MQIIDFLNPEAIFLNIDAKTSEEVIRKVGGRLF